MLKRNSESLHEFIPEKHVVSSELTFCMIVASVLTDWFLEKPLIEGILSKRITAFFLTLLQESS